MTTRYQKSQIEDVARILVREGSGSTFGPVRNIALDFADLFAADNPPAWDSNKLVGGFDRERFLAACGLESEG